MKAALTGNLLWVSADPTRRTRLFRRLPACFAGSLLLFISTSATAQKVFDFNASCRQAYRVILQLKLDSGRRLLEAEKMQEPDNLIPYFLENYIDFFTLFFNEDPAVYAQRIDNREKRLDLMQEGPDNSPFYLFTQAVIHFQWAAVRIKFGYNWDAGWEFRRSYLQVKENSRQFPDFSPDLIYNGAMQVAIGTIPDGYKWLAGLLGMQGSIKTGMRRLDRFLNSTDEWAQLFQDEAIFYDLYLKFYIENDKQGVFNLINSRRLDLVNDQLFTYLAANLSINDQQSARAEAILRERNPSPAYFDTPVWDLEMGYAKINHLEPDAAGYLERFLARFKGKFYVKDALQKLSWYYYLEGDAAKAGYYRHQLLEKGGTSTEADKQALREARSGTWPNKLLLRARLLNDGGYHREALQLLLGKRYTDFTSPADRLEFAYRVGRIYDDMRRDDEAINFYKTAITLGKNRREYYAARATLQIGLIFEQRGEKSTAIGWFQRCLDMPDHEYKNSLDQRAKAGIARCKGQ